MRSPWHPASLSLALTLIYSLGGVSLSSSSAVFAQVLNSNTDAFINGLLKDFKSPGGIAVAVVRKDAKGNWVRETKGYGVATLADGKPVTKDTLFGIGSNSKLFTALSIGLVIHNETLSPPLSWSTKLASVIRGFGLEDSVALKEANIKDAMSHRTGLPRHDESLRHSDNIKTAISKVAHHRPSAEFRDVFQYNNNMYTLLSSIPTAVVPGKPSFPQYVQQHILDPLQMTSTTYSPTVAAASGKLADGIARQFINTGPGAPVINRAIPMSLPGTPDSASLGFAGVISNSEDTATWLQMLLLQGRNPQTNVSVVPPEVVNTVSAGISIEFVTAPSPELSPQVYGGGQDRGTYRGHEYIGHGGAIPGFKSAFIRFPWDNLGVAVLSNDEEIGRVLGQIIQFRLVDEAYGLSPVDWTSRYKPFLEQAIVPPPPPSPTPPANATFPPGDFARIAGVYVNPGYGQIEICLVFPKDPHASRTCNELASNISTILPGAVQSAGSTPPPPPTYFASWPTGPAFRQTHMRMTHLDGYVFGVDAFVSYPTGNTTVPFWTYFGPGTKSRAEVDLKMSGLGFTGIWGAGTDVPSPVGNTVQKRAEVWFERV